MANKKNWVVQQTSMYDWDDPMGDIKSAMDKLKAQAHEAWHTNPFPVESAISQAPEVAQISLPPVGVKFLKGQANAAAVKDQLLKDFEQKLDEELNKLVQTGELKPSPWHVSSSQAFMEQEKNLHEVWKKHAQFAANYSNPTKYFPKYPELGNNAENNIVQVLLKAFPKAMKLQASCPIKSCSTYANGYKGAVAQIVPHLNDFHGWKTTRIAEWMENTFDAKDLAS